MALIKCNECGKEISDKAATCIHCGCPLNEKSDEIESEKSIKTTNMQNDIKEKEILSIILDIERFNKIRNIYKKIGIVSIMLSIVLMLFSGLLFDLFIIGSMILPIGIIFLVMSICSKKFIETSQLILTNKRIKGSICVGVSYATMNINIPLDKIDNIAVLKNSKAFSSIIEITSNNATKTMNFVLNADEFVDATIKEIEKYRNR